MATEVKERSVPKPVFTDAEAGAKEFPVLAEPQLQLLRAAQAPRDGLRGRHDRRPARPRAPPVAGLGLLVRQRRRRLPAGVVGAEVDQLARVPRSQRGVGADDLSQQRERRPPDLPEHRARPHRARLPGHEPRVGEGPRAPRVRVGARSSTGIGMHVYTPAQRDAPTNMINNAICVGAVHKLRFAQDLILYNLALSEEIEGFEGSAHKRDLAGGPDLAADARAGRGPDRHPRLGGGVLRHDRRLRAAGRRAVPLGLRHAGRRAAGRLRHADDHGRRRVRRGARAARRARAVPDARRRRRARRRQQGDHAGLAGGVHAAGRQRRPQPAADLVAALREGRPLRGLLRPLAQPASRACSATSASRPRRRSRA